MLKSAVLLSKKPLHFYIFAEDDLHEPFKNAVSIFSKNNTRTFLYFCIHFQVLQSNSNSPDISKSVSTMS